jgi:hypothetical protein
VSRKVRLRGYAATTRPAFALLAEPKLTLWLRSREQRLASAACCSRGEPERFALPRRGESSAAVNGAVVDLVNADFDIGNYQIDNRRFTSLTAA